MERMERMEKGFLCGEAVSLLGFGAMRLPTYLDQKLKVMDYLLEQKAKGRAERIKLDRK